MRPAPLLAAGVIVLSCCVLTAWVGGFAVGRPSALLQEGIFTPGVQETIEPEYSPAGGPARRQALLSGYTAMGTVGGGEHGLHLGGCLSPVSVRVVPFVSL